MPIQDDSREIQMIDRFNLVVPPDRRRGDIDAHLKINGLDIPFELKSTTTGSIATVRDFGMSHIDKWRTQQIHWLFGFYLNSESHADYFIYCSPKDMEKWYSSMERYIKPDIMLGKSLPEHVDSDLVKAILGDKDVYTYEDARSIMKNQYTKEKYEKLMDLQENSKNGSPRLVGYSLQRMTVILRERAAYVIARGSTLNNPHIPENYFDGMPRITDEPAIKLREMVKNYLENKQDTEEAAA
ncbi:MAG: hypothetical protein I3I97_01250 [Bifidobacterium thermophilum]|nr:hypothetical protein [Bifidobacterium thermophilum]